jgi:redox-sensitive bicupin YhaK (pirin superfamily)
MNKVQLPDNGGAVNIIAGNFNGKQGPAKSYTPVNLFDIRLSMEGQLKIPVPENHNTAILVINGNVRVNDENAAEHSFILFANEGEEIIIHALTNSVILLLSGEPINEPIASYGPFVMNTQEEIYDAIKEFQEGKFGVLE